MFLVFLNPFSRRSPLSLANIGKTATAEKEMIAEAAGVDIDQVDIRINF